MTHLLETLGYLLRGTGRRRAADTIPVLEQERDSWQAKYAALQERLGHADELLVTVCCQSDRLRSELEQVRADLVLVTDAHRFLLNDYDELAARHTEQAADLANLQAIWSPAPADSGPAIKLGCEDTAELAVAALWDGLGLRPLGSAA